VICYGLRTDFRTRLFEGSKRLLELADNIEEIKNTCHFCNKKAVFNQKFLDGVATLQGPTIQLGAEETYLPVCAGCYDLKLNGPKKKTASKKKAAKRTRARG
jgi:thymidine kinase